MASSQKLLIKNSFIYSIFTILQRAFSIVLLPIYTTYLSGEEYGVLSLMLSAIPLITLLLGMSFRGSVGYFYYHYKDTPEVLRRLLGTSFVFITLFAVLVTASLCLFNSYIFHFIFKNIPFYPYILLALISSFFQPAYLYYQSLLRTQHKAKKSSVLDMLFFILTIILTVVFIMGLGMKAEGALLALAIANFVVFIFTIIGIGPYIKYCFDIDRLKEVLKFSLPVLPHALAGWATNLSDRLILNFFVSLSTLASFDIGSQIGKVISIASMGINQAYNPWFIQQTKSENTDRKLLATSTEKITTIYFILAVLVTLVSPELISLLAGSKYPDSWQVVPFIAISFALNGFYFCFTSVFFLNNTKYLPVLTITGAVVNVLLNILLIPYYGIIGAAVARIASKIIFVIITYKKSQQLYRIPYNISYILIVAISSVLICSLLFIFPNILVYNNYFVTITIKTILIVLCCAPIIVINRQILKNLLKQIS